MRSFTTETGCLVKVGRANDGQFTFLGLSVDNRGTELWLTDQERVVLATLLLDPEGGAL